MKRLLSLPIVFLSLVGCVNNNPPIQPRADPYARAQIHMTSEDLRRETYVDQPILAHNESDLLVVTIPIRSAINKTLYVDYYVTFFDRNGIVTDKYGPFTKVLKPNTPDSVQATSTNKATADFQVDFRYAK